jgi:hypothetical protein
MRHFGFAQLRFVVAAILLLAAGLKAWQLATAPLPPVVHAMTLYLSFCKVTFRIV